MKTLQITAALVLVMSVSAAAVAQQALPPATPGHSPVGANAIGQWLYNQHGDTIGSVRSLANGGQTAVLMIGNYLRPGSYEARTSTNNLSVINGKVTLQSDTVLASNTESTR